VTSYTTAWLVIVVAAVLGTLCLVLLTRHLQTAWLRRGLRWLPLLLLTIPAGIPGYDGDYAPAFVVAVFEALFQTDGNPWPALRMLALAFVIGVSGIIVAATFSRQTPDGNTESS